MLERIEDEFNYDHRTHNFVTSTISVVVQEPTHVNCILNANYHAIIMNMNADGYYTTQKVIFDPTNI